MIRKTLTILSLIGLLLSVGLWVVGFWRFSWHVDQQRHLLLTLVSGRLVVHHSQRPIFPSGWAEEEEAVLTSFMLERMRTRKPGSRLDLPEFTFEKRWGFFGYRGMGTSWWPRTEQRADRLSVYVPLWISQTQTQEAWAMPPMRIRPARVEGYMS